MAELMHIHGVNKCLLTHSLTHLVVPDNAIRFTRAHSHTYRYTHDAVVDFRVDQFIKT